jgi:hypothetical protein
METTASDVIEFLTFAPSKGMMNRNTAGALRAAVREVISTIDGTGWEIVDIESIDVADYLSRFERLSTGRYKPDSLTTYKSRFKNAIEMFRQYKANPSGWRYKPERPYATRHKATSLDRGHAKAAPSVSSAVIAQVAEGLIPYPYPLRNGVMVELRLPTDLTRREARRLSAFIEALAVDTEEMGRGRAAQNREPKVMSSDGA